MKKFISLFLTVIVVCTGCTGASAEYSVPNIYTPSLPQISTASFVIGANHMTLRGEEIPMRPSVEVDGVTLVPVRVVSETFDAQVDWDEAAQKVTILKGKRKLELTIGEKTMQLNGQAQELLLAPQLDYDTTMVPLRVISEALGADVSYDEETREVGILVRTIESTEIDSQQLLEMRRFILNKVKRNAARIGDLFPEGTEGGVYHLLDKPSWVGGFYTGLNYLCYEMSGDEAYIENAQKGFYRLKNMLDNEPELFHHDLGFTFLLSYYQDYLHTGNEESKKVVIQAGDTLMARIKEPGYVQGWNVWGRGDTFGQENAYRMIVDSMCNIPILYVCTELTGDERYQEAAIQHAKLTEQYLVRDDYTTTHTFVFTPEGEPKYEQQFQGAYDSSCWSRGQAWVINGMAIAYRATGDESFLETSKRCNDTFLRMTDEDLIPRWDLVYQNQRSQPKDASAGAIVACGLMDLYDATGNEFYRDTAYQMLLSLYYNYSTIDPADEGLILHATAHVPNNKDIDCSLIYGDYYFAQLVYRFLTLPEIAF